MTVRAGAGGVMADDGEKRPLAAAAEEQPPATAAAGEPPLKEWAPLNHLMLQVPAKYQNLLATGELHLTCVSAVDEHILLGTNTGSVYWYDAVTCAMQRYRAEGQLNAVCRVSAVTSVDHLLAAGHRSGDLSVFLVPRLARGDVPEYVRITERNIKKGLQFSVDAGHRSPVSALAWSRNAARLFSGDETGAVAVTEIDYVTETVTCRLVTRESSPVVQLQYSRQTLLVATRDRSCLIGWSETAADPEPKQIGTKQRKSAADLGACFLETDAGLTVLAARPSLKVVTADLQGQVSATVSLKPTLSTAGAVSLLFPVSAPGAADTNPGPGRLQPLWPGAVALYDSRTLLVVDVSRWEIVWRCDQLPAILDVAASSDVIFVLCSPRRLIRLSRSPDTHPAVCESMRPASGDLSLEAVMQELRSAVPVNQVKTLLNSVQGQLGRTGLLEALNTQKEAVSSLTSRVSSLVTSRLGSAVTRDRPSPRPATSGPLRSTISSPDVREAKDSSPDVRGSEDSSPDVREAIEATEAEEAREAPGDAVSMNSSTSAAAAAPTTATVEEPIARQVRPRRRPGRRRAGRPGSGDSRSLETQSLGGETASLGTETVAETTSVSRDTAKTASVGRGTAETASVSRGTAETASVGRETKTETASVDRETSAETASDRRETITEAGAGETAAAVAVTGESGEEARRQGWAEERVENERTEGGVTGERQSAGLGREGSGLSETYGRTERRPEAVAGSGLSSGAVSEAVGNSLEAEGQSKRKGDPSLQTDRPDEKSATPASRTEPLDFTQFYPQDLRPRLQRTDSELEEERRDKERRLAALLGLEELSAPPPPPPPPAPREAASSGSSGTPSPPAEGEIRLPEVSGRAGDSVLRGEDARENVGSVTETELKPEPSYHSLFPFNTKRTSPAPPPAAPSADSETGEPLRHSVQVRHPTDPPRPPSPSASDPETATEATEDTDPAAPPDWRPWQRHTAPAYFMTLSACERYAVATDADCGVHWTPTAPTAPVWERLEYTACQVAVSWDGARVWRLDGTGAAYSLADPAPDRPCGSHWVRAARDVLQLAADSAAVWYIKRGGKLFVQRDLSAHRCASPELAVDTPEPVIHVTARQGVVWAVAENGSVLWRVGVSRAHLAGYSWEPLSLGSLRVRAAFLTAGELGWLADDRGRLHLTTGVSASLPRGMDGVWRRVLAERSSSSPSGRQVAVMSPGAALRPSLAVEGDVAWLAEPGVMNVMTCRHHIIAVRWEQYVPRGRQQDWAEVHADGLYQRRGQLWAVTSRGQLYGGHGHDGDLQPVPLPERGCQVACVSAAPGALWLLTASGAVFVREGVEQSARGTAWLPLDLLQMDGCRLVHLSVGAQSVWACDASGRVLVRLGPTVARRPATGLQPAWVSVDQPAGVRFVLVCVGPADQPVWALDTAGVPWRRCGLLQQPVVGSHWRPAGGLTADRLALSPAGVWARCRRSGLVHRWVEEEGVWCRVPGSTRHMSVSVSGELWVVHRGALYTLHEQALRPGRCLVPRVADRPPAPPTATTTGDEDRDWELVTC